jgi:antitoxin component YwqK of YwqJK toxin-antitoxin module
MIISTHRHQQFHANQKILKRGLKAKICLVGSDNRCQADTKPKVVKHGKWQWWWPNGQLQAVRHYEMGSLSGVAQAWYANGTLRWTENYLEHKLHGKSEHWYDNGQLKSRANFEKGQQHGLFQSWWWNGKLSAQGEFVEGKPHGQWRQWYINGHKNNLIVYQNGQKHGRFVQWWWICRPERCGSEKKIAGQWSEGKQTGRWTYWYFDEDGQKQRRVRIWY